jgi:uncharacterized iron-regulated membrane protein
MLDNGLDQLIETERRLALRLEEARTAAAAVVAEARRAADDEAARFHAALAAAERSLAGRIAAEQQAELAAIAERTGRELARLRSLPDAAITAMADSLLELALTRGPEDAA